MANSKFLVNTPLTSLPADSKAVGAWVAASESVHTPIVATAAGTQANANLLLGTFNEVTTVATANDSVRLPLGLPGLWVAVRNSGVASMQVYGSGTDTINGVATATGVAQATGTSALYFCVSAAPAAKWFRVLSA
jgi:hypothetical protein